MPERPHRSGGCGIAKRHEAMVSAEPMPKGAMAHEAEADHRQCSLGDPGCAPVQDLRHKHQGVIGGSEKIIAPRAIMPSATTMRSRLRRTASTKAPRGPGWRLPVIPPIVRIVPIDPCDHPFVPSQTETNGPKPVWTSAMKKFSQSRPRWLRLEGAGSRRARSCGPIPATHAKVPGCVLMHGAPLNRGGRDDHRTLRI